MIAVFLVGVGGCIGSILRYEIGKWVHRLLGPTAFPYGTFTVNFLGCLLIGFVLGLAESRSSLSPHFRTFLAIGLLGGFTTFSTFGYDTLTLIKDSRNIAALVNICLQPLICLGGVWLGHTVSKIT